MACVSKTALVFLCCLIVLFNPGSVTVLKSAAQLFPITTKGQGQQVNGNHELTGTAGSNYHSMEINRQYEPEESRHRISDSNKDVYSVIPGCSSPLQYTSRVRRDVSRGCVTRGRYANCKGKSLTHVPQNLPRGITWLDLSHNNISRLPDRTFQRYRHLKVLILGRNHISSLCPSSFYGLSDLYHLQLKANNLLYQEQNFPPYVFSPLQNLRKLELQKNNPNPDRRGLSYPDTALSTLTELCSLYLDGLTDPVFGSGFQNITSLRYLIIKGYIWGYCKIKGLRNETFRHLSTVNYLTLKDCFLTGKYIEPGAFTFLENLTFLDLSHNEDIGYNYLHSIFQGLRNATKLRQLNLQLFSNRYSLGVCLSSDLIRDIPQSLTILNVEENSLQAVDRSVMDILPPGLEELSLSGNKFVFGTYLQDVHKLKFLKKIKVNGASFTYNIPKMYPFDQPNGTNMGLNLDAHLKKCDLYGSGESKFILKFPPNLTVIEMMDFGLVYKLSSWTVDPNNRVESINISKNKFPELLGPILGFNQLRELDIHSCLVTVIYSSFFRNLTSLETLNLAENFIGFGMKRVRRHVFSSLVNLRHLDLSLNSISRFESDAFTGLSNLEFLDLDDNPLVSLNVDMSHMMRIQTLRLAKTQLSRLPVTIQRHVDSLFRANIHVFINMSASPLMCSCENLDFLKWMVVSGAFDPSFHGYQCAYEDLAIKELKHGYNETVKILEKECTSHTSELIIAVTMVMLTVLFISFLTCYQFRWKLKYLYYIVYLRFRRDRGLQSTNEFEYDVFISSASEDSSFVIGVLEPALLDRGLKVLLHERDFQAGEPISTNIVRAVHCCRKTLVLLTASLLNSQWCNYEIQMANVEAIQTGRRVLLFLLKEMPSQLERTTSLDVIYNIQSNTYCEFPHLETDPTRMKVFWDRIARDLKV